MTEQNGFWPGGARLAVSVSMQFEAGGQPVSGAGGPITEPILPGFPDLGQNTFYEYGAREGVPRILDLLDTHGITMTSFMIGDAVRRHPEVAAEIVRRGHEAGAHGRSWQRQYQLPRPQEKDWIADSLQAIEQATGIRPAGYNNYWILEILQELGFTYHIDDLSADEPFLQTINGQPFATMIPARAWHRMRTGSGTKGTRHYDWAMLEVTSGDTPGGHGDGHSKLLARRHRYTGTVSFYRCWSPGPVPLSRLIAIAVARWSAVSSASGR
jgi:peptidoglycan/xylan/chitin deacetylase (PgdA/CDA1 family)